MMKGRHPFALIMHSLTLSYLQLSLLVVKWLVVKQNTIMFLNLSSVLFVILR